MRRTAIYFSRGSSISGVSLTFLLAAVFLFLLIFPSVSLCGSWEAIGPEGGNFIFSVTNTEDANEITAITTSPSPSNVYRSIDAGASWSKIGEIPYPYVYDVTAFDFSRLYAISYSRCYRSTNGGVSWTYSLLPSSAGSAYYVCVDPTNGDKVYAAGYDYNSYDGTYKLAFFKSTNGGLDWNASSFFSFESFYPTDMAISKSNPNVIYVSGYKRVGLYYYGALLTTSDAGDSWTDVSSSVDPERYSYFYSVAIDPTDEYRVYVGGDYFYRCSRSGRANVLSWTRSSNRLYTYTINIDPVDTSRIYIAGYQTVGISTDYGQSWSVRNDCVKSLGIHIEVAPASPSNVFVSTYAGFYKSPDRGTTWSTAHEGIYAARIAALAAAPSKVIVQNSGYLMEYGKTGRIDTWQDIVTPESCGEVCDILINPDDQDIVLILEGYG